MKPPAPSCRRLAPIFVAIISGCFMTIITAAAQSQAAQEEWNLSTNGIILKYSGRGGEVTLPGTIDGKPVTSLGVGVFSNCATLTGITIPDSVTMIGVGAFIYCTNLTRITIPDSVTKIGDSAFMQCTDLTNLIMGKNVTSIGDSAFSYCVALPSITLPREITNMGADAFIGCSKLEHIIIPANVTTIGREAFRDCISLSNVTLPNRVTNIGESSFEGCKGVTNITLGTGVTKIGIKSFYGCVSLATINLPPGITEIGGGAFGGCASLTSITIPDSVTRIGEEAFADCTNLTNLTLGNGLKSIGRQAFWLCSSLNDVRIPESVTKIEPLAFSDCQRLANVTIPNGLDTEETGLCRPKVAQADELINVGKYDEAIKCLTESLQDGSGDAEVYAIRADAYMRIKGYDKALQDCHEAMILNPLSPYPYRIISVIYEKTKKSRPINTWLSVTPDLTKATLNEGNGKIPFVIKNTSEQNVTIMQDWSLVVTLMTEDNSGKGVTIEDFWNPNRLRWYDGPGPSPIILKPGESGTYDSKFTLDAMTFVAAKIKKIFGRVIGYTSGIPQTFACDSEPFDIPPKLAKKPWVDLGEKPYFLVTPELGSGYLFGGTFATGDILSQNPWKPKPDYAERIKSKWAESLVFSINIKNITDQSYIPANDSVAWYLMRENLRGGGVDLWEVSKASTPILKPGESTESTGRFYIMLNSLESKGYHPGDKIIVAVGGRIPNTDHVFESYSAPFTLPILPKGHAP